MAKTRRALVIVLAIGFTIIGPIILMGITARVAVWMGYWSYLVYFVFEVVCSFSVLLLYNPAKEGFFKRLMNRLARFNFERPSLAKLIRASQLFAIFAVNFIAGPLVGAIFIKRLGYAGKSGYILAVAMDALSVGLGNTFYLFGIGEFLKKLI
ncbi:MAG: hypothetical protein AAB731_02935 [Patescibacteria group bacterium]